MGFSTTFQPPLSMCVSLFLCVLSEFIKDSDCRVVKLFQWGLPFWELYEAFCASILNCPLYFSTSTSWENQWICKRRFHLGLIPSPVSSLPVLPVRVIVPLPWDGKKIRNVLSGTPRVKLAYPMSLLLSTTENSGGSGN